MTTRLLLSLLVATALLASSLAAPAAGITAVLTNIGSFQTYGGGFAPSADGTATLESTEQALFLAALFGAKDQINSEAVATFLQSVATSDKGFSNVAGGSADVTSTLNAFLSFAHLGKKAPATAGDFLDSCYDADTRLYANTPGASGDVKSTARALRAFELLGSLESKAAILTNVRLALLSLVTDGEDQKSFSAQTEDNAFAIQAAAYAGFDFGDAQAWASYFYARQNANGGFNSGPDAAADGFIADAAAAIQALYTLQKATKSADLVGAVDSRSLLTFVFRHPPALSHAFYGFKALARTRAFNEVFQTQLAFEPVTGRANADRITAGSEVAPIFLIRSVWGAWHSGFDVTVNIKQGKETSAIKLAWNGESTRYATSNVWQTGSFLGRVQVETLLRLNVPDLGDELLLRLTDTKSVGYDMAVATKATLNGKEVDVGASAAQGTEFVFDVSLGTVAEPKLLSGDFDLVFQVKDSSLVVIHEQKVDARKNANPFHFTYTLNKVNLPSGNLVFSFAVSTSQGVHTTDRVLFQLPLTTVAAELKFNAHDYALGEDVEVQMVPATLQGKSLQTFDASDVKGKSVSRRFYMDIVASSGEVVATIAGVAEADDNDKPTYKFVHTITASFDSIGSFKIVFRYESAEGASVTLQNYDSSLGELYGDARALTFKVKGDLRLTSVESTLPADGKLKYGDTFSVSFKVTDKGTGKPVSAVGDANAYAILKNQDKTEQFVSARVAAVAEAEAGEFKITFVVNPNAVAGKGQLQLVAQGADGKEIALVQEDGAAFSKNVEVTGELSVQETAYAKSVVDSRSMDETAVFFVNARVYSGETSLSGAKLIAKITGPTGQQLALAPVTEGIDAEGVNHGYQVSWSIEKAAAGTYTVDFFRASDRRRLATATPFAHFAVRFEGSSVSALPVRTEFFVISLVLGAFVMAFMRYQEMTKKQK